MNDVKVSVKDLIAPVFYPLHNDIKKHKHTHYWLKGGRGSTKSSVISIEIILGMMRDSTRNGIVFRKVGDTLRESVYEQLVWAIEVLGVSEYWDQRTSPLQLIYKPTKQKILFRGVDDPSKSKSIKLRKGYFAYVWFEELAEFSDADEISTILQSLLRGGSDFWCFYSYNPPRSVNSWVNYESQLERTDKIVHHSTYLDVPPEWLGQQFLIEAETKKRTKPDAYEHEYLGKAIGTGGEVFNNVVKRKITDEEISIFDRIKRGLDWGYAADPFSYLAMHYDKTRKRLFIFYEYYKLSVSNSKAAQVIKKQNPDNSLVICDSAEPKSVKDLQSYGIKAIGAKKGPGSIETGIKFLADELEEIIIDPDRCPNTYREFSTYELEKDRFGNFKSDYPDKNNHSIDATRYGMERDSSIKTQTIKSGQADY